MHIYCSIFANCFATFLPCRLINYCTIAHTFILLTIGDSRFEIKCAPDEYAALAKALRESGLVTSHRKNLKWHKKTIIGSEATEWLANHKNIGNFTSVFTYSNIVKSFLVIDNLHRTKSNA